MKIKLADYPNWKQVEEKQYRNKYFNNEDFKGNVSLLTIVKVKEKIIKEKKADMVIGDRLSSTYFKENKRPFHNFGNKIVRWLINTLFQNNIR